MPNTESVVSRSSMTGSAGEYYVLYRLYRKGVLAALAPANTSNVDILVMNHDETIKALLQVKSRTTGANRGWQMKEKHEGLISKNLFYAFVDMEESEPVVYII